MQNIKCTGCISTVFSFLHTLLRALTAADMQGRISGFSEDPELLQRCDPPHLSHRATERSPLTSSESSCWLLLSPKSNERTDQNRRLVLNP